MTKKRKILNDDKDEDDEHNISSRGNLVYFHAPVSRHTVHCLITELHLACEYLKNVRGNDLRIKLYIHSEGGDTYAGLSAMEHINNCEFPVDTFVDGYVASAATFMILGGKRRFMNKYSELLIHQFSLAFSGRYTDFTDQQENNEKLMKIFKGIYKNKTKIPTKILNTILSREISFSSDECLKYGIVDELI